MANGLGIERGRTVQASINTGAGFGSEPTEEEDIQSSAPDTSPRPRARPAFMDDDDDDNKNTLTVINEDSGESDSISISNADLESPLSDTEGNFIGKVNLKDGKLDFEKKFVDLYSGGLYDEGLKILPGVKYGDTVTGNKGIKFKTGVGEVHADLDIDAYDAVMRGGDVSGEANLNFVFRPQSLFPNRAEGGSTSDKTPVQMEMDLILRETKDPVSGNTAPLGATPEEVRDDIPINASPNEFVINAATRRYYGTEFFEELQKSAAEGWKRIKDGKESYFRDDELDVEDDEKRQDKPINMQEGGTVPQPVGGGYGGYGGTGSVFMGFEPRVFINDTTGQRVTIFFFNGRPLSRIPSGFREKEVDVVEEQKAVESARKDRREEIEREDSFRTKNVDEWEPLDYQDHYDELNSALDNKRNPLKLSIVERAIVGLVGSTIAGPIGGIGLVKLAEKQKRDRAQTVFEKTANIMDADTRETKFDDPYYATVADTNYILGSALGVSGYDPVVANPFKDSELNEYGFPTQEARDKRDLKIFDLKKVPVQEGVRDPETGEIVRIGDVDEYYAMGGFRPRSRPPTSRITETPRTDPDTGEEDTVTGNRFTEMLGGLGAGKERSRADVQEENLASSIGVSVDRYRDMSPYERSQALGGSDAADDRDRRAFQDRQQRLIDSGGDVQTAFASEIAAVDRKERSDFINNLREDYLRATGQLPDYD